MSLTNEAQFIGVRHARKGTYRKADASQAGAGTTVLYTVTAATTLHLSAVSLEFHGGAAGNAAVLQIRDTTPAKVTDVLTLTASALETARNEHQSYPVPIEIPAGYTLAIIVTGGGDAKAFFHGWEE